LALARVETRSREASAATTRNPFQRAASIRGWASASRCRPASRNSSAENPSRLAERLGADLPTADRHALQLAEQGVEFGLHTGTHPGHHHRRDARQGQVAITGKSARAQAHLINQGGVEKKPGKLIQQRLGIECLSS
jgi:hypothetical protein